MNTLSYADGGRVRFSCRLATVFAAASLCALMGLAAGCHRDEVAAAPSDIEKAAIDHDDGAKKEYVVTLTAAQVKKLGLVTAAAKTAEYSEETPGFGVVLSHEPIASAVAELTTAQVTLRQARSALNRVQRLAGTPGAVSTDIVESSIQQEAVDVAQLRLSQQKLTALVGQHPPWDDSELGNNAVLEQLATGRLKLLRLTFPSDVTSQKMPWQVRAERIGASGLADSWASKKIWNAPADVAVPGRSYFALLETRFAAEGEHLQVWASTGKAEQGVAIPLAALLLHDNRYWCYLEKMPDTFVRTEIDLQRPTAGGYVMQDGVSAGDKLVIVGASHLLAQESGADADPD